MTTNKRVDALNTVQRNGLMPPSNSKDSSFASPPSFTEQKEGVGRGVAHAGHHGSEGHRSQDQEVEHQAENDELNTPALTETNPWSLRSTLRRILLEDPESSDVTIWKRVKKNCKQSDPPIDKERMISELTEVRLELMAENQPAQEYEDTISEIDLTESEERSRSSMAEF